MKQTRSGLVVKRFLKKNIPPLKTELGRSTFDLLDIKSSENLDEMIHLNDNKCTFIVRLKECLKLFRQKKPQKTRKLISISNTFNH